MFSLDLRKNRALNEEAAREAGLDDGEMFTLANFSYSNFAIVQQMYHHLRSTDYLGINVCLIYYYIIIIAIDRTVEL